MRIWEIILLIIIGAGLAFVWFQPKLKVKWVWAVMATFLLVILVQGLGEGWRWQMVPAYLSPLFLLKRAASIRPRESVEKRYRVLRITGKALLLAVYLLVSIVLPLLMPVFTFKKPSGEYAVGTTVYHWVDQSRKEEYTEDPSDQRELMVQLWYPAEASSGKGTAAYTDQASAIAEGLNKALSLPSFALSHLGQIQTHALIDAKLAVTDQPYPLLIFSHGLTGFRSQNTFELEELASHGYIVAAIDHTYDAAATVFPDGREAIIRFENLSGFDKLDDHMKLWTGDVSFVLDQLTGLNSGVEASQFKGRMDMTRIGMFGHSYGGAAAAQMLMNDARIKAAVDMDGVLYGKPAPAGGIGKPFLLMNAEKSLNKTIFEANLDKAIQTTGKSRASYEEFWEEGQHRRALATAGGGYSMLIPNTDHMSYTDFHLFSPMLKLKGEDPRYVHQVVNAFTLAFFDNYLKGKTGGLEAAAAAYPEVGFKQH
ncbi:carboxylic ester hydrolase [Paenibacillus sp. CAA11]|uniref:alpha/beta hydrolase family protein n=1 Tax=Paenibacillus sp. CAA11 TaxID=1532905 RepID=UPI000D33CEEF|nr:carboxylic ester hydrolase [Paenibacillus sp. CAA11]AWB46367.1 carboxylic ester hydrolase [Paenibacillus sp. CAA11]